MTASRHAEENDDGSPAEEIREWVQSRRVDVEEHLTKLVEIETPTEEPRTFDEFFQVYGDDLRRLGLETERVEGTETGGWLEAWTTEESWGVDGRSAEEIQLLLGHADTVWPLGTVVDRPPERQEEDVFVGPGSLDMKAGLTQTIYSLHALEEVGLKPELPIYIMVSSDEEVGSPESKPRIRELAQRANRVFVLEPASGPEGRFKTARKAVGRFTVEIQGKAAHAGIEPEEGASATQELGSVIGRLHALTDVDSGVTVNVGEVEAGFRSNVVAPTARADVDVRAPTEEAAEEIEKNIRAMEAETPGTELSVSGGFGRPPMERTPGNRVLWQRVVAAGKELGLELEDTRSGGASDGNDASQYAATIDGFGAVGDGAHQEFEYVNLRRLLDRVALLALCLLDEPLPQEPGRELDDIEEMDSPGMEGEA